MRQRRVDRHCCDDDGFTLVELLVAMSVGMIVLFAILGASDIFRTSTSTASQATAAQDAARASVREMVGSLRQGRVATGQTTPIPSQWMPSRQDLTVAAFVTPTEQPGWVRYCASTTGSQSSLITGVRVGDTYAAPGSCSASDTTNGWTHAVLLNSTLQDPTQLFDFTSSTCTGSPCLPIATAVQSVGIRVAVARSPGATGFGSVVRDAVSFRNRSSS